MRADALAAIANAWAARDQEGLAAASRASGLELSLLRLQTLYDGANRNFSIDQIVATISEALEAEHGIAYRESSFNNFHKAICIALRTESHVVAAARTLVKSDPPSKHWPELKPWYKQLAKNRKRLETWAATASSERVRFPITGSVARDEKAALEAELMQQIVANPDDPGPRLVLADLLLERGDIRGEIIRGDATRAKQLAATHARYLAGEIAEYVKSFTIANGFVDVVEMTVSAFRTHGERVLSRQPVREVWLGDLHRDADYECAALDRVRSLVLRGTFQARKPLLPARLARAQALFVSGAYLPDPEDHDRLVTFQAPALQKLALSSCMLGGPALRGLAANPLCRSLVELDLSHCIAHFSNAVDPPDGTPDVLAALAELEMPALKKIDLRGSWFEGLWQPHLARIAPALETVLTD